MKQLVAVLTLTASLILFPAGQAAAQTRELAGGFSLQKWNTAWNDSRGFVVDFAQAVHTSSNSALSVVVDFGMNAFPDEETDLSIVGGVRERFLRNKRCSPFIQATAGIVHWSETFPLVETGNDPVIGGGGGVQIRLTPRFDVKAQYDAWRSRSGTFDEWSWMTRLYIGAVIKLDARR